MPRKSQLAYEYRRYLAREHGAGREAKLGEAEFLVALDPGCSLCPEPAVNLRNGSPYCLRCDDHMRYGTEAEVLAWVRKVYAHRIA